MEDKMTFVKMLRDAEEEAGELMKRFNNFRVKLLNLQGKLGTMVKVYEILEEMAEESRRMNMPAMWSLKESTDEVAHANPQNEQYLPNLKDELDEADELDGVDWLDDPDSTPDFNLLMPNELFTQQLDTTAGQKDETEQPDEAEPDASVAQAAEPERSDELAEAEQQYESVPQAPLYEEILLDTAAFLKIPGETLDNLNPWVMQYTLNSCLGIANSADKSPEEAAKIRARVAFAKENLPVFASRAYGDDLVPAKKASHAVLAGTARLWLQEHPNGCFIVGSYGLLEACEKAGMKNVAYMVDSIR